MTLRTWASLTASIWLAAVRGLLIEQRTELADAGAGPPTHPLVVERLAEQALRSARGSPGRRPVRSGRRPAAGTVCRLVDQARRAV